MITLRERSRIEELLREDPARSNATLAAEVGVSAPTVARVRHELEGRGKIPRHRARSGRSPSMPPALLGDDELAPEDLAAIRKVIIEKAKSGDIRSALWVMEHLALSESPPAREAEPAPAPTPIADAMARRRLKAVGS